MLLPWPKVPICTWVQWSNDNTSITKKLFVSHHHYALENGQKKSATQLGQEDDRFEGESNTTS